MAKRTERPRSPLPVPRPAARGRSRRRSHAPHDEQAVTVPLDPDDELTVVVVRYAEPFPTDGDYVRRFYMSQVGPTGTALLQLLAAEGSRSWRAGDLACRLGVSAKAANHAH